MKKLILATLLLAVSSVVAAPVPYGTFSYTAPTERLDNTPMTIDEIAHFKVYRNGVEVDAAEIAIYPLPNNATGFKILLNVGPNDFNLVTVDTAGRESGFSTTVSLPWAAGPKPVSGFTGQITVE